MKSLSSSRMTQSVIGGLSDTPRDNLSRENGRPRSTFRFRGERRGSPSSSGGSHSRFTLYRSSSPSLIILPRPFLQRSSMQTKCVRMENLCKPNGYSPLLPKDLFLDQEIFLKANLLACRLPAVLTQAGCSSLSNSLVETGPPMNIKELLKFYRDL